MSVVQPRLYRASAGTGKTFALTTQALRLLVRGIDPESLLATTFTRKAAGEIQERILGRLVDAVGSEDVLIELNGHLESDPKLERDACVALLSGLLRRIDRLGVQTLDAFFVRLATLWGLELGLPPGWEIIEETSVAGLHEEAIARVLDDANEAELLELLRGLQREEPRRSVYGGLRKLVVDAYGIYLQSTEAAWEALPPLPLLGTEELAKRLDELRIAPIPQSASTERPNKNWVKAHAAALQCVESGHWEDLLSTGLAKKVLADDLVYSRHAIEGAMRDALQALVLHARAVLVQTLLERSRSHRELLRRFHEALEGLKRERRLYDFDDLPRALQRGAEGTLSGESLAFRLDGGIDHLLLDEFQDTSALQGGVLGPLLERVLDEERAGSFFCVGDTKQSIYGWRQGEPRLLLA